MRFVFSLFLAALVFSMNAQIDSLQRALKSAGPDTNRVNLLNELAWQSYGNNVDTSILLSTQALELAQKLTAVKGYKRFIAQSYHQLGWFNLLKGEYLPSIENNNKALDVWKEIGNKDGIARTTGNLGIVYKEQGNYTKALDCYFSALRFCEETHNERSIAINYSNIGVVYNNQKDPAKAIDYFTKALAISQKMNNKVGMAANLGNLGNAYEKLKNYDQAEQNYTRCLQIAEEIGYKQMQAIALGNLGLVYSNAKDLGRSLEYFNKALKIEEEMGDATGVARNLSNIGDSYRAMNQVDQAETYLHKALKQATLIGAIEIVKDIHEHLSVLYSQKGDHKKALEHFKKHIAARDSLFNEENTKKAVQTEMNYEFDKKEATARAEQEKKDAIALADKKRQQVILMAITGFGLLVLGFAVFAWRSFLQKKKANAEISRQKELIEEKQKEVLDSIYYARRIQRSLLTSETYIRKSLLRLRKE